MERPNWAPADVDVERPSVARVYDYYLGGSHNFAVDREFAERVLAVMPSLSEVVRENRAFLRRAVRFMCEAGIRQFVDLGSGIPTVGNVHEVAQSVDPAAKVVYVDNDPVAVAHSRVVLADNPNATIISADLRKPDAVLTEPDLRALIDLSAPVGVLAVSVLHFIPDEQAPADIVAGYVSALARGSYVAVTHASTTGKEREAGIVRAMYNQAVTTMTMRTQEEIGGLFGQLRMVEPGVVELPQWHPEHTDDGSPDVDGFPGYGGVGHKD